MTKIYLVEHHWAVGDTDIVMATLDHEKATQLALKKNKKTKTSNYTVSSMVLDKKYPHR